MARDYELMIIYHPELDATAATAAIDQLRARIAQVGEVTACDVLGQRRLAYEVRGVRQGIYVLVNFTCDPSEITPLRQFIAIQQHDQTVRYLLVVDEKRGMRPPTQALPTDGAEPVEDVAPPDDDEAEVEPEPEAEPEAEAETEAATSDEESTPEAPEADEEIATEE